MSPYCPALLEHNVLPLPSDLAGLLPWLYLGLSVFFTTKSIQLFLWVWGGGNSEISRT